MMKKLLFIGTLGLLLIGCQAEEAMELPQDNAGTANAQVEFTELCHWDAVTQTFQVIAVPQQAVQPHLNHGDALVDADRDGYSAIGSCTGSMDDCDDLDPNVNPEQGCETVFVIAYSNLNGEDGYQEGSADVLISKLVDFNNDGVVSVGDKVITNQYPKDFDATTFGNFTVKEHLITEIISYNGYYIDVFSIDGYFNWYNSINGESYLESTRNTGNFTHQLDAFMGNGWNALAVGPLSPSQPIDNISIIFDFNIGTDDNFLDVDIFL